MANEKFVMDLSDFAKKARGNMDAVVRKVILDIGTRVVLRSPVGNPELWKGPAPKGYVGGRFRANWQYGDAAKPKGTTDAVDPSGGKALTRLREYAGATAAGRLHFITNNLPYAMRLETGWSRQAPAGMVGLAVREFQAVVAAAAKGRGR